MALRKDYFFIFIAGLTLIFLFERIRCFFYSEKEGKVLYKWLTILPASSYSLILLSVIFEFLWITKHINVFLSILGVVFIILGIILRRNAIRALGELWSTDIKIFPEQKLIKDGPYKIMRHPYLFSVACELIGLCLFLNSFFSVLLVFLLQIPLLIVRGFFEEKFLYGCFGVKYLEYKKEILFL